MNHRTNGILRREELAGRLPSDERLKVGPIAVIECVENIPCNPCVGACPKGCLSRLSFKRTIFRFKKC